MGKVNLEISKKVDIIYRAGDSLFLDFHIKNEDGSDYQFTSVKDTHYDADGNWIGEDLPPSPWVVDNIFFTIYDKNKKATHIFSNTQNGDERDQNYFEGDEGWWEDYNDGTSQLWHGRKIVAQATKNLLNSRRIAVEGEEDFYHPFVTFNSKKVSAETNEVMFYVGRSYFFGGISTTTVETADMGQMRDSVFVSAYERIAFPTITHRNMDYEFASGAASTSHARNGGVGNLAIRCDAMSFPIPVGTYSYELKIASDIDENNLNINNKGPYFKKSRTWMHGSFIVKKE
mgnify:FL=1